MPREAPVEITSELLLKAYAAGLFPMAESADDPVLHWVEPHRRGIIPLESFAPSRKLLAAVRSDRFRVTVNHCFDRVIAECAAPAAGREGTWINARIRTIYGQLHRDGHAHSVEVWDCDDLAGGLYGVSLGAAFFGESMFHRRTDASKVALVHLVARLKAGGYRLLDTQFITPHLASLGAVEIPRGQYLRLLTPAIAASAQFGAPDETGLMSGAAIAASFGKNFCLG
jgi:leucyl/phenylalanyl-tRNA---protein transferase